MLSWMKSDIFAKFMGGFVLGIAGVVTLHMMDAEPTPVSSATAAQESAVL